MATWQFNLFFIPKQSLLNKYQHIPTKLLIDFNSWDNHITENDSNDNNFEDALSISWWLDLNILTDNLFPILERVGPVDSWGTTGLKNFGSVDTNNISVCFDEDTNQVEEVSCRFDLREIDTVFIDKSLSLARQFNCLLMDNHGVLIHPVLSELINLIKSSNALRFVADPYKFLNDLSEGKIKL